MAEETFQPPKLSIPNTALPGVRDALRHWHEHRPRMYTEMHNNGTLIEMANTAYEAAAADSDEIQAGLEASGYDAPTAFVMAERIANERYIYLPTEEDVPDLMTTPEGVSVYGTDSSN